MKPINYDPLYPGVFFLVQTINNPINLYIKEEYINMNMSKIMSKLPQVPKVCDSFKSRHSTVMKFLQQFKKYPIKEGAIITVSVKNPDGYTIQTKMKVTKEDLDIYNMFI